MSLHFLWSLKYLRYRVNTYQLRGPSVPRPKFMQPPNVGSSVSAENVWWLVAAVSPATLAVHPYWGVQHMWLADFARCTLRKSWRLCGARPKTQPFLYIHHRVLLSVLRKPNKPYICTRGVNVSFLVEHLYISLSLS